MTPRRPSQTNQQETIFGTPPQGDDPRISYPLDHWHEERKGERRGGRIGDEINANLNRRFPRKAYVSTASFTNESSWIGDQEERRASNSIMKHCVQPEFCMAQVGMPPSTTGKYWSNHEIPIRNIEEHLLQVDVEVLASEIEGLKHLGRGPRSIVIACSDIIKLSNGTRGFYCVTF
ncbi:hypothetical protein B9Z19DRAFT_1063010 [Tuber borchii]|uniref:Uncharacterized protein n=1 Tax=Tuber borchii TaxID=42251 RepID=A0A2T6ZZL4_TUBBO|nr:hypothetical protein B9Z19DRAFT_1063010 [Tuber borchii]